MKKYFCGIGSRQTPESLIPTIQELSKRLINLGFILRSGAAQGADSFWENAYDKFEGEKEIYLPWKNFNNHSSPLYEIKDWARETARMYHSQWDNLSDSVKNLHARNVYQIRGCNDYWDEISSFIICYTPDGKDSGGTGHAIRLARQTGIPVFNLHHSSCQHQIDSMLTLAYSEWS